MAAAFDQAIAAFGTVDILMNNAGVDASGTDVGELSTQLWDIAIRTNVYDGCSKGALRNLTRTLALELAPLRINVNNLARAWS